MYNFHKVKNKEGLHEFKHDHFRRGARDDLRLISRKVADNSEVSQTEAKDQKSLILENNRLKKEIAEREEKERVITAQTKLVIDSNKDLIYKIYKSKTDNDLKIRKLMFLYFAVFTNYQPALVARIKSIFMRYAGMEDKGEEFAFSLNGVSIFVQSLIQNVFSNGEKEEQCINALMSAFLETQNEQEAVEGNRVSMDQLLQKLNLNLPARPTETNLRVEQPGVFFGGAERPLEELSQMDRLSAFGNSINDSTSMMDMELSNFKIPGLFSSRMNSGRHEERSFYAGSHFGYDVRTPQSERNDK